MSQPTATVIMQSWGPYPKEARLEQLDLPVSFAALEGEISDRGDEGNRNRYHFRQRGFVIDCLSVFDEECAIRISREISDSLTPFPALDGDWVEESNETEFFLPSLLPSGAIRVITAPGIRRWHLEKFRAVRGFVVRTRTEWRQPRRIHTVRG